MTQRKPARRTKQDSYNNRLKARRLFLENLEQRAMMATLTWQGDDLVSPTAWSVAENWDTGTVPSATDDVIVNNAINDPILGSSVTIGSLSGNGNINLTDTVTAITFTNDAGTGIGGMYTHAVDLNAGGTPAVINGVTFEDANATSGANWSLTGVPNPFPGAGTGSDNDELLSDFYYNGNPGVLTLTGLTPGQGYDLRLYQKVWSLGADRSQQFTINTDGIKQTVDLNPDGIGKSYFSLKYTAGASGTVSLTAEPNVPGSTYHWYGFTNQTATITPALVTLTVGNTSNTTFAGNLYGTGAITKVGSGTLTLGGTNTFTGGTNVNVGVLKLGDAPSRTNLLGEYRFDDASNLGLDTSGNANNGTVLGQAIGRVGARGASLTIPGNGYLQLPDLSASFAGQAGTLSMWLQLNDATPTDPNLTGNKDCFWGDRLHSA